jgi:hypothetical protein
LLFAFKGIELLILPIMAPWLTKPAVADFARTMRPRQVLAAHGGYAKDFFYSITMQPTALILNTLIFNFIGRRS